MTIWLGLLQATLKSDIIKSGLFMKIGQQRPSDAYINYLNNSFYTDAIG